MTEAEAAVSRVFREEAGRLIGSLVRRVGDFDLAEELVQDAIVEALEHWPVTGVPANPGGWLRLIFTCCHPALAREAQVALTLRAVAGLTTAEIAHAFLAQESAVAQRI